MVEYGNGVGEVAGRAGGGSGPGGGAPDVGASLAQMVNDSVNSISALPTEVLVLGIVLIIAGLFVLKRAF